jgi:hypothetical protein
MRLPPRNLACLLEGEGFVSPHLFEAWRPAPLLIPVEEGLIGLFDPLADILDSLRADQLPEGVTFAQFSNMSLKLSAVQVLAPPTVVPTMQGNAMVVDYPRGIDDALEVSIPLVLIELELQSLHRAIVLQF